MMKRARLRPEAKDFDVELAMLDDRDAAGRLRLDGDRRALGLALLGMRAIGLVARRLVSRQSRRCDGRACQERQGGSGVGEKLDHGFASLSRGILRFRLQW